MINIMSSFSVRRRVQFGQLGVMWRAYFACLEAEKIMLIKKKFIFRSIAIFILFFISNFLNMTREIGIYDEGIILENAERMLAGDVQHVNFYANYGPAQSMVVAASLQLFGHDSLGPRFVDLFIRSMTAVVVYGILTPLIGGAMAVAGVILIGCWFVAVGSYLYPVFPCILLGLLSIPLISRQAVGVGIPAAQGGATGLLAGLATLFRYEIGLFIVAAAAFSLALSLWLVTPAADIRRRLWEHFVFLASTVGGMFAILAPIVLVALESGALSGFFVEILQISIPSYASMRSLPFPSLIDLIRDPVDLGVYLPFAAGLFGIIVVKRYAGRSDETGPLGREGRATLIALSVLSVVFALKGIVRVSPIHMLMGITPAIMVFMIVAQAWRAAGPQRSWGWALLLIAVAYPGLLGGLRAVDQSWRAPNSVGLGWLTAQAGDRGEKDNVSCDIGLAWGFGQLANRYVDVVRHIRDVTSAEDRIFVAVGRHDKIFVNPVALYFAADRRPATRWHHFDPGVQTRADVQEAIVTELLKTPPALVVRDRSFDSVAEPNESAMSSGNFALDRFLDQSFRVAARYGNIEILAQPQTRAAEPHHSNRSACLTESDG
jgi:hypothetical protein